MRGTLAFKDRVCFMKTLLVTGGAGFIGSNFVLDVLELGGYRVVNLDALTYAGNLETLAGVADHPAYRFEHGDIGDRERVQWLEDRAQTVSLSHSIEHPGGAAASRPGDHQKWLFRITYG